MVYLLLNINQLVRLKDKQVYIIVVYLNIAMESVNPLVVIYGDMLI